MFCVPFMAEAHMQRVDPVDWRDQLLHLGRVRWARALTSQESVRALVTATFFANALRSKNALLCISELKHHATLSRSQAGRGLQKQHTADSTTGACWTLRQLRDRWALAT